MVVATQQQLGVLAESIAAQERKLKLFSSTLGQVYAELQSMIADVEWDRARIEGLCTSDSDRTATSVPFAEAEPAANDSDPAVLPVVEVSAIDETPSIIENAIEHSAEVQPDQIAILLADVAAAIKPTSSLIALLEPVEACEPETATEQELPIELTANAVEVIDEVVVAETVPPADVTIVAEIADLPVQHLTLAEVEGQMTTLQAIDAAPPALANSTADSNEDELIARDMPPHIVALLTPHDPNSAPATSNLIELTPHRNRRSRALGRLAAAAASLLVIAGGSVVYQDRLESGIGAQLSKLGACSMAAVATDPDCAVLAWLSL